MRARLNCLPLILTYTFLQIRRIAVSDPAVAAAQALVDGLKVVSTPLIYNSLFGKRCFGHLVWDTLFWTPCLGHLVWDTLFGTLA